MIIRRGNESHFKKHIRGRWMIDRVKYRNTVRLYAFFTCPLCGGINQAHIVYDSEKQGEFDCIYCSACHRNLDIVLDGFGDAYFHEESLLKEERKKRRKHEPVHV